MAIGAIWAVGSGFAQDGPAAKTEAPAFEPGHAEVVPPDDPLAVRFNPDRDPTVRMCREPDGTIWVIHTDPVPGREPYPDDPADLTRRPC